MSPGDVAATKATPNVRPGRAKEAQSHRRRLCFGRRRLLAGKLMFRGFVFSVCTEARRDLFHRAPPSVHKAEYRKLRGNEIERRGRSEKYERIHKGEEIINDF